MISATIVIMCNGMHKCTKMWWILLRLIILPTKECTISYYLLLWHPIQYHVIFLLTRIKAHRSPSSISWYQYLPVPATWSVHILYAIQRPDILPTVQPPHCHTWRGLQWQDRGLSRFVCCISWNSCWHLFSLTLSLSLSLSTPEDFLEPNRMK